MRTGGDPILVHPRCALEPDLKRQNPRHFVAPNLAREQGWTAAEEMGRWLDPMAEWYAFCTFTFDERWGETGPSPDRALTVWREWYRGLGRHRPRPAFVAVERGGKTGRTHLHALLGPPGKGGDLAPLDHWRRKDLWRSWFNRFGRAQLVPFDPEAGAAYYCAKYVSKAPELWDIFN